MLDLRLRRLSKTAAVSSSAATDTAMTTWVNTASSSKSPSSRCGDRDGHWGIGHSCPLTLPLPQDSEHSPTSRGEASMRTPKVPVRLQRHRAWDPFLCTSSQSRAVHMPCWSALWPQGSQTYHPLWGVPHRQAGVCERQWEGPRVPGVGEQHSSWVWVHRGIGGGPRGRLGLPGATRGTKGFQSRGPHGPGGSHCTQMALLRFAVCSRRNSRLIGDSRTPLRKLRPWNTATLTTGEFITGFWGSLRRQPTWAWAPLISPGSGCPPHCLHVTCHGPPRV